MTDQDILPTLTATFPLWRSIIIREGIDIIHTHQATSVMSNESVVYAAALGLPSVFTDHSLFQFDDLAGVILNRVLETTLGSTLNAAICVSHACRDRFKRNVRVGSKAPVSDWFRTNASWYPPRAVTLRLSCAPSAPQAR